MILQLTNNAEYLYCSQGWFLLLLFFCFDCNKTTSTFNYPTTTIQNLQSTELDLFNCANLNLSHASAFQPVPVVNHLRTNEIVLSHAIV